MSSIVLALLLGCSPADPQVGFAQLQGGTIEHPNIILAILDDVDVFQLAAYGAQDPAHTPTIDGLASSGAVFERCWSMPVCSPTRACIATGLYPFRTGIGDLIAPDDTFGLPIAGESYLWNLLRSCAGYQVAAFGKWHVTSVVRDGLHAPNDMGFERFSGHIGNVNLGDGTGYTDWLKVEDGVDLGLQSQYVVIDQIDEACKWLRLDVNKREPWFIWLGLSSAHYPLHVPPASLVSAPVPPDASNRSKYLAMIEAGDHELGRLIASLSATELAETIVIVVGDNGSAPPTKAPQVPAQHGKATTFEGGIRVPLIISGVGVPATVVPETLLANVTDLWATVLDLAGVTHPGGTYGRDSKSLVPAISASAAGLPVDLTTIGKAYQYSEQWAPSGLPVPPKDLWRRAVSNARYKLTNHDGARALYDLWADPTELNDLFATGLPIQAQLVAAMAEFQ